RDGDGEARRHSKYSRAKRKTARADGGGNRAGVQGDLGFEVSSATAMAPSHPKLPPDEITPEPLFQRRREFLKNSVLFTATSVGVGLGLSSLLKGRRADTATEVSATSGGPASPEAALFESARRSALSTTEPLTPLRDVTTYNNFYEFG